MTPDPAISALAPNGDFGRLYQLQVEELADYALFLMDTGGKITSWNRGVRTVLQYEREEFLGKQIADLFTPEDRAAGAARAEMQTAFREGRSSDFRWHVRRDGSRVFVDGFLYSVLDEGGRVVGYSKVMRDATARHHGESALRASEAFARSIVESSPDSIKVLDLDGRLQSMNQAGCREMEIEDFDQCRGRIWLDFWEGEDRTAASRALQAARAGRQTSFEAFCASSKGTPKWWEVLVAPILDGEGKPARLLSISRDITQRKEAAKVMQRSHEDLAGFAHVVSHDLQAPLRTMRSYAQLLSKRYKGQLDASADTYISFMLEGAQNMEELICGLLHYAEFGEEEERERIALNDIVDRVVTTLKTPVDESGASITCGPLPELQVNPTQVQQVFQNLISNALKYRSAAEPRVHIAAEHEDRSWVISVKDNGVGIAPEHFERIFLPLKRLHGSEIAGTGLGLAVCKRIVEKNGGRIWVESRPGEGSTFYFTLAIVDS